MKPYYQDEWVTIYHGDCREILPTLEKVDLVLTDPPYPKLKGKMDIPFNRGVARLYNKTQTIGTPWGDDLTGVQISWEKAGKGLYVFCSFHSVMDIPMLVGEEPLALITWYKRNTPPSVMNVPQYHTEFIWVFKKSADLEWRKLKTFYDIPKLQAGCMATERIVDNNGKAIHPTQKPVLLMCKLLAVGGDTILDPYMGIGSTLVASKKLNRRCIGIEIEEKYCEIAAQRCSQGVFDLTIKGG